MTVPCEHCGKPTPQPGNAWCADCCRQATEEARERYAHRDAELLHLRDAFRQIKEATLSASSDPAYRFNAPLTVLQIQIIAEALVRLADGEQREGAGHP